jgi:hypothetical protein
MTKREKLPPIPPDRWAKKFTTQPGEFRPVRDPRGPSPEKVPGREAGK